MTQTPMVAYFSMEIGLGSSIPTYSGGLGVLAGDTIRSAADLEVPMVAVTLLHRQGYFYQHLDAKGHQTEEPVVWSAANVVYWLVLLLFLAAVLNALALEGLAADGPGK